MLQKCCTLGCSPYNALQRWWPFVTYFSKDQYVIYQWVFKLGYWVGRKEQEFRPWFYSFIYLLWEGGNERKGHNWKYLRCPRAICLLVPLINYNFFNAREPNWKDWIWESIWCHVDFSCIITFFASHHVEDTSFDLRLHKMIVNLE